MTAIADAIRDKTGRLDALTLDDMAGGVTQVYDAGKQAQYDDFWDSVQNFGKRTRYYYGFDNWAGAEYIRPKYKVIPKTASTYLFNGCTSLKALEKDYFDFSQIPENYTEYKEGLYALCNNCSSLEIVEDVNFQPIMSYAYFFAGCINLKTIEVLRVSEKSGFGGSNGGDCFYKCTALENVSFEGVIGKKISFPYSPLSIESLKSVITHLKDYSGTDSEYTCTVMFKTSAFEALEAEGATSPNNNTWAEYIDDLKWNLTLLALT